MSGMPARSDFHRFQVTAVPHRTMCLRVIMNVHKHTDMNVHCVYLYKCAQTLVPLLTLRLTLPRTGLGRAQRRSDWQSVFLGVYSFCRALHWPSCSVPAPPFLKTAQTSQNKATGETCWERPVDIVNRFRTEIPEIQQVLGDLCVHDYTQFCTHACECARSRT